MVFMRKEAGFGEQIVAVREQKEAKTEEMRALIEAADRNSLTILTKFNPSFDWQGLKTTKPPPKSSGGVHLDELMDSRWAGMSAGDDSSR